MKEWQWIDMANFFKPHEFDDPAVPGSGMNMDYEFMRKLYSARYQAGCPFVITRGGGWRSKERDVANGGKGNHSRGIAADIKFKSAAQKFDIVHGLMIAGFKRIIIYKSWIHVDSNKNKVQKILKFKEVM